jgi:hypothetical protein
MSAHRLIPPKNEGLWSSLFNSSREVIAAPRGALWTTEVLDFDIWVCVYTLDAISLGRNGNTRAVGARDRGAV